MPQSPHNNKQAVNSSLQCRASWQYQKRELCSAAAGGGGGGTTRGRSAWVRKRVINGKRPPRRTQGHKVHARCK